MAERVDVLAYDEPVESPAGERGDDSVVWVSTWVFAALAIGYALLQGQLLVGILAGVGVLAVVGFLFGSDERPVRTRYRAVDAGQGEDVVAAHEVEARKRRTRRTALVVIVASVVLGYGLLRESLLVGAFAAGVVVVVARIKRPNFDLPRLVEEDLERERAEELFDLAYAPESGQ
jgi:hypothetical protein